MSVIGMCTCGAYGCPYCWPIDLTAPSDLYDLGFTVFIDADTRRQLIGYKYI